MLLKLNTICSACFPTAFICYIQSGRFFYNYSRFIETFGTHVIVGVKMGGKDVIYMKQQHSSTLQPADVQKKLKDMADKRFIEVSSQYGTPSQQVYKNDKVCACVSYIDKNCFIISCANSYRCVLIGFCCSMLVIVSIVRPD